MTLENQKDIEKSTNEKLVEGIIDILVDGNLTAKRFLDSIAKQVGYSDASTKIAGKEDPKDPVTDPKLIAQIFRNIAEMDLHGLKLEACYKIIQETGRSVKRTWMIANLQRQQPVVPDTAPLDEPLQPTVSSSPPSKHVPLEGKGPVRGDTPLSPEKDPTTSLAKAYLQEVGSSGLTEVDPTKDLCLKIFSEKNPELFAAMAKDVDIEWPYLMPTSDSSTKPREESIPSEKKETLLSLLEKLENNPSSKKQEASPTEISETPPPPKIISTEDILRSHSYGPEYYHG